MLPFGTSEDEEIHLLDYLKIVRKRMWMVIVLFVVVVAVVTIKTFKTIPTYQATARVVLEQNKINVGFQQVVSDTQFTSIDFYANQCETIKSRSLAKKVIDSLDLKNNPEFNPPPEGKDHTLVQEKVHDPFTETRFINKFLGPLKVTLMRNSGVVSISYEGPNPQLITGITNTLVKSYIEQDWEKRYNMAKDALDWLNKQLKDVKIVLEESEAALQRYKKENDLIAIESVRSNDNIASERQNVVLQKLMELNAAVTNAKTERVRLEVLYNKLKEFKNARDKDETIQSIPGVVQNGLIQTLKANYARAENEFSTLSQRYGVRHPKMIQLTVELNTMRDTILKEVDRICESIATEYEIAKNRETTLLEILEQQKNEVFALGDKAIQYGVLKREVDTNKQMYETLLTRMKETNLTEDLKTSNIKVLDYAEVPIKPIKPKKSLNILLGIIVGLTCGVGIAFFMEYLDNKLRTQEDVEKYLKTSLLGIVGHIPLENREDIKITELIAHDMPKHTITEALRYIRTSIMFSHPDNPKKIILVTSATPSEGKSLISSNLAIVMAQTGKKVLLIDADLRKPTVHKLFQVDKSLGLSNLLVKTSDLCAVLQTTHIPNVSAIACGPIPPNPSELLSSPVLAENLALARKEFEWILIDSPPILSVTDARILSKIVDGIVFVMNGNKANRDVVQKAMSFLSDVNDKMLGVVINDVDLSRDKYYYHYYYQYYYHYGDKEGVQA